MYTSLVHKILRAKDLKGSILREFELNIFENVLHCPEPPTKYFGGISVETGKLDGWRLHVLKPAKKKPETVIVYLHGGAFIHGFIKYHWKFMAALIRASGCEIWAPDYPLAPSSVYHHTYDLVEKVYHLIQKDRKPKKLIFMGDSAGGGLALGLAIKLQQESLRLPDQLFLLSPWLDLTMSNPDIEKYDRLDPIIEPVGLKRAAELYAGGTELSNWMISPINGKLTGLPPIHLYIGDHDILYPDALRFYKLCQDAAVPITLYDYKRMVHVWMILTFLPQAKRAIREISHLL